MQPCKSADKGLYSFFGNDAPHKNGQLGFGRKLQRFAPVLGRGHGLQILGIYAVVQRALSLHAKVPQPFTHGL